MKDPQHSISPIRHRFIKEGGPLSFRWVIGGLVFVALSGVAVWLLPFSAGSQMTVLFHTALGLAVTAPLTLWQLSHWLAARRAPRRIRKISAYTGFWLLATSCVSGLIITYQALGALRVAPYWHSIHLWTGIFALPFLAHHLYPPSSAESLSDGMSLPRGSGEDYGPARRRMWRRATGVSVGLLLLLVVATLAYHKPFYESYHPSAKYENAAGVSPFAPSFASTENGRPIAPQILSNSDSCGVSGCHTAIYREWLASAHRWSAEDEFFQAVRSATTEVQGIEATEKCAGCHEPVSLLGGYNDPTLGQSAPGYKHGDSCLICHGVRHVDERGIGSYEVGVPRAYLYEYSDNRYGSIVTSFLIRAYPAQHDRDYDLKLVRQPESCAPCHKEFDVIDKRLGRVQVETQYDDWKQGQWNTDSDVSRRLRCQQCHMYFTNASDAADADPYDLEIGLGLKHRNHWFAAGNQFMPEVLHSPDATGQVSRVTRWLQGDRIVPEAANAWPPGPIVALKIEAQPSMRRGSTTKVRVTLTNRKVGHSFPTGPLNIGRAWIELDVLDSNGREVFHSGRLDPENHIEAGSFVLKPLAITTEGKEIMMADLWHPLGPKFRPAILPGHSETYDYHFKIPENATGPLKISARLRYRKANQFFMDSVYTKHHREAAITDVSSEKLLVAIDRR
jgi:hypothetical protein